MNPLFEIGIFLPEKGSRRAARSLYEQLKTAIVDGRLTANAQLPPTRKSAEFLGVSRNTAAEIYDRLQQEGLVVIRHGSGTFVASGRAQPGAPARSDADPGPDRRLNEFWLRDDVTRALGFWHDHMPVPVPGAQAAPIDFRPALVDSRLFPFDVFRRVSAKQLRGLERRPASFKSPQGNQGNFHLRQGISRHIALTRAVVCAPDDILVSAGAQQAFDLLARILVERGKTVVAIEDPGYPPMRVPFAAAGARIVPIAVDGEGLIVEQLPSDAGVICVCPSHQFPLGVTMSARRRRALIAFARAHDAVIVEDDYDGEFRFGEGSVEALRTPAASDVVFYVGTFSKCMLPSLRLGFVVAPPWAMRALIAAKNGLDWHCPTPLQLGVAAFIAEGHLAHHVRKMRSIYLRRRNLLINLLRETLSDWLTPIESHYGMHLAATTSARVDLDRVTHAVLQQGLKIHSLSRYYLGEPRSSGLVFGYGAVDAGQISRGLTQLCRAFRG